MDIIIAETYQVHEDEPFIDLREFSRLDMLPR